ISRWRLWPQLRLTLPVAVTPKRFFAPLLVFILGIFRPCSRLRRQGMPLDAKKRGLPSVEGAGYSYGPPRMQGRGMAVAIRPAFAQAAGGPAGGTPRIAAGMQRSWHRSPQPTRTMPKSSDRHRRQPPD